MDVLLCLLSDQHVPNLLSVHHHRPELLVLVESREMRRKQVASHFIRALNLGGLDYRRSHELVALDAEDSIPAIRRTLTAVYSKYPQDRWIANITGGTKPMSLGTYVFFKEKRAIVVYTNVSRPAQLIDIDTETQETCGHQLSVAEFLAGYGFECRQRGATLGEVDARARSWWGLARTVAAHARARSLLPLSDDERQHAREAGIELAPGRLRHPDKPVLRQIALTFGLDRDNGAGSLSPNAADFVAGGWLEVFFWGLLNKHSDALGVWDVRLDLELRRAGDAAGNEVDVAFMTEHRLCLLECKSGAQGHDRKADVLYKIAAVARQFQALRVQSYLATTADSVLSGGKLKDNIRERARLYNCRVITARTIRQLAQSPDDLDLLQTKLFGPEQVPP
jgi:Domain of unknown function (DUF1887)